VHQVAQATVDQRKRLGDHGLFDVSDLGRGHLRSSVVSDSSFNPDCTRLVPLRFDDPN
jgi:hypothetical protein